MKLKLSQILKYSGIVIGALGALKILYAEVEILQVHWICDIVIGIGALVWFVGAWEAKHEAAVEAAKAAPVTATVTTAA